MIVQARRHEGTKARSGFSLVEVLLAIIILGIGIISISALFPAGIAQQRQSFDDVMGPVVANNALAILRSKLRQTDFGTFEATSATNAIVRSPRPTLVGDWPWLRPGLLFDDETSGPTAGYADEAGALDVFSFHFADNSTLAAATEFPDGYEDLNGNVPQPEDLYGIPYAIYPNLPPLVLVTRHERYYPMPTPEEVDLLTRTTRPEYRPQFVWECMFRRYQGRVQVAVFVFRVGGAGGRAPGVRLTDGRRAPFAAPPNPFNQERSLLPLRVSVTAQDTSTSGLLDIDFSDPDTLDNPNAAWDANGPNNDGRDRPIVLGTADAANYDVFDPVQSWQEPGQHLVDQNGNIHRVLSRFADDNDYGGAVQVELVRPLPGLPRLPPYYFLDPTNAGFDGIENLVTDIWYIPRHLRLDTDGDGQIGNSDGEFTLTPVFVTVSDL